MPKVTLRETAVATSTDKKTQPVVEKEKITDSLGRVLTLRKLTFLMQSRIIYGLSEEEARKSTWLQTCVFPAASVEAIDDDLYGIPQNKVQAEAMLQILGDEGVEALMQHFADKIAVSSNIEEAAKN